MELKYGFISADDHVQEHREVWTSRMSRQKWGNKIPHVDRQPDGSDFWVIGDQRIALPESARETVGENRSLKPKQWEEVPRMAYSAPERLAAMDLDRAEYSVLYPTAAGRCQTLASLMILT
jgi:hypothetical protein